MLHQCQISRDEFEKEFGSNRGIPAVVCIRWNLTVRQFNAIVALDQKKLTSVLKAHGHKNLILTSREWTQLSKLCEILEPFLETTNISQGSNCVTVSKVLPAVLSLRSYLQGWMARVKYCKPVLDRVLSSLLRRFSGLFVRATPPQQRCTAISDSNYGSDIYTSLPLLLILHSACSGRTLMLPVAAPQEAPGGQVPPLLKTWPSTGSPS